VKMLRMVLLISCVAFPGHCDAQTTDQPRKHLLALGEEKGYRHEAVSHAIATIERLGRATGLWTTTIRTDTEVLTKKKLEYNAKNLNDFDAVLFYTGGELEMSDEQKAALLSFIRDDGKGFVGVHSATITFTSWREYGEMIGGYFDEHPWGTFNAPILVEDPNFAGMQQWPKSFVLTDEIYQMKDFSRDKVRVLMRLDATKLDLHNPRVHRKDLDFAVTWAKMYGKGRVYYSTLGHVEQNWDDPRIQKMYVEAVKWAMGLVDADVTPRTAATQANDAGTDRRTEEAAEFTATSWQKGTCRHFARYDGFSHSGTGGSVQECGD
jgi:type 1 glutamine amidotransferase